VSDLVSCAQSLLAVEALRLSQKALDIALGPGNIQPNGSTTNRLLADFNDVLCVVYG
jgi:hypothetical protein